MQTPELTSDDSADMAVDSDTISLPRTPDAPSSHRLPETHPEGKEFRRNVSPLETAASLWHTPSPGPSTDVVTPEVRLIAGAPQTGAHYDVRRSVSSPPFLLANWMHRMNAARMAHTRPCDRARSRLTHMVVRNASYPQDCMHSPASRCTLISPPCTGTRCPRRFLQRCDMAVPSGDCWASWQTLPR